MPFELLLTITQGYRTQIHCRYANCYALWNEIHITSIFSPEDIYNKTVSREKQEKDTIKQLLRRIHEYTYHYVENGEYKEFTIPASEYNGYDDLKQRVLGDKSGFITVWETEVIPFDEAEKTERG